MNEKNTKSFNIMQSMINHLNKTLFAGKNYKLTLEAKRESMNWYRYYVVVNTSVLVGNKNTYERRIAYSGRPEAVIGYLQGLQDSMSL